MRKRAISIMLTPLMLVSCSCEHKPAAAPKTAQNAATPTASPSIAQVDGAVTPVSVAATADQSLRITVLNKSSSAPVYHAGLNLLNAKNLTWTDQSGQYTWSGGGYATVGAVEIRCPAMRAETGRKIDSVPYTMKGALTEITATVDIKQCVEPPERSKSATYAGTFMRNYSNGYFVPCSGMPANAAFYGNSKSAWVSFSGSTKDDLKALLPSDDSPPDAGPAMHVEWAGTLTGPGAYGPQGMNAYKFQVTAVTKASADFPDDCPAADIQ